MFMLYLKMWPMKLKIFANHIYDKGLISKIYKIHSMIGKKNLKWAKMRPEETFF